jgi:uncharacterized membrane protein YbaN (DUF454 family)
MLRAIYVSIGVLCVGLGVLGAVLPVLPTTPFLLVAAWAFAKSSARLERWLLRHPRLGPPIERWRATRAIPLSVKLAAWASMAASLTLMLVVGTPWYAIASAAAVMVVGATYVATRPSR